MHQLVKPCLDSDFDLLSSCDHIFPDVRRGSKLVLQKLVVQLHYEHMKVEIKYFNLFLFFFFFYRCVYIFTILDPSFMDTITAWIDTVPFSADSFGAK